MHNRGTLSSKPLLYGTPFRANTVRALVLRDIGSDGHELGAHENEALFVVLPLLQQACLHVLEHLSIMLLESELGRVHLVC